TTMSRVLRRRAAAGVRRRAGGLRARVSFPRSFSRRPHADLALADDILHFAIAAIEGFADAQVVALRSFSGGDRYSARAGRARRNLGAGLRAFLDCFDVHSDGGAAAGALYRAVDARDRRFGLRRRRRLVGHARLAPGVECGPLFGREEEASELLRAGAAGV